jgi:hypothetical protein
LDLRFLLVIAFAANGLRAEPGPSAPEAIVEQFCAATEQQERVLANRSMEVDIQASLPKLKKKGRLHAFRRISSLGRISYSKLMFDGDGTVKNNVIARYLTAEAQAQASGGPSLAVTPQNYKFKYKGRGDIDGRPVHIFQVTPRTKRVGLFRGDVWIDAATYLRLQEAGYFVKNPSFFLKKIAFVRKYEIRDGFSVPRHIQTVVDTRLVGKAEMDIEFSNFSREERELTEPTDGDGQ